MAPGLATRGGLAPAARLPVLSALFAALKKLVVLA